MKKMKYALAALAIAAVPVVATSAPAFAQLSNCSGYIGSYQSYNSICYAGSGLQRAWIKYWQDAWGPGVTFIDEGAWAGPGQYSHASAGNGSHIISYGRNYYG